MGGIRTPIRWRVAPSSIGIGMVDQSGASMVSVIGSFCDPVPGAIEELRHQRGPAGLVAGTQARAGIAVEVFVKEQPVAGAVGPRRLPAAEERAPPLAIGQEDA